MMKFMTAIFICVCIFQFIYIWKLHKQAEELLRELKEIRLNPLQKLFTQKKGIFANIKYEVNGMLQDNQEQLFELKKADTANKQILTNLSHDVRTPLASLLGYLEALHNNSADDTKEYIHISYQKALSLKALIDTLFEWCKINSNEQNYEMDSYDMNELTRAIMIDWLQLLERNNVSQDVNISEEEYIALIDRAAYKRILDNLIQNAIQHGKCSTISIDSTIIQNEISITIFNNGNTIPEQKLPYIFDRLYKCDPTRSERGTGLGLSITKELVTVMKGRIDVTSSSEYGTSFILYFPLDVRKK